MLQVVKRAGLAREQQAAHRWERFATGELTGQTLGIVGHGRIGREVARLARAFDMRVIATKRHTEGEDAAKLGVDSLYPWTALLDLLAASDYVVLVCPHTPETEGLIDAAALAAMKPGAALINIARGAVVDEPALIEALRSGQVGHAALDVAAVEPLPADSPLWDMAQVSIYPHSASTSARENERLTDLFCENLRRYLAREPLLNTLNVERMY
jgi:glyoxylate/hydroxypyruvate reductase A